VDTSKIEGIISHIKNDVDRVQSEVNELYKTVYKGNGSPSLVSQSLKLENQIVSVETSLNQKLDGIREEMKLQMLNITNIVNEKFSHLSHQITSEFEHKKIKMEGSWKIKVAVVSSIFALITSLLPTLLSILSNVNLIHK